MSRTIHDTPSFPRTLRGPRGGRHTAPTPCSECVSFASCRPGACSAPFGCESWVDEDGRRVEPEPHIDYDAPDAEPCRECGESPECETCGQDYDDPRPGDLDEPDPDDPNPYAPSSATLAEISGIPFEDFDLKPNDPGPLFGGPASD